MKASALSVLVLNQLLSGCAVTPPTVPYPAFINVNDLSDVFVAGLPGSRAKPLASDPTTKRASFRVAVPPDWQFTTGASSGQNVEIYVLAGELKLGDFLLTPGGYGYVPAASTGMRLASERGALFLYFIDEANTQAVIQTPLITNSELVDWKSDVVGLSTRDLRLDPGSGARTWLLKLDTGAIQAWQASSQSVEGYLLSGDQTVSECVSGEIVSAEYAPGGYFFRPSDAVHGGPESKSVGGGVWLLRVSGHREIKYVDGCSPED